MPCTICRLHEIGRGDAIMPLGNKNSGSKILPSLEENSRKPKAPHCTHCGHPGSKRGHLKSLCEICSSVTGSGCVQKPLGFKCYCSACDLVRLIITFSFSHFLFLSLSIGINYFAISSFIFGMLVYLHSKFLTRH